ncbi:MAG: ribosomal protein [Verrucomicrobiota bacterium]|jgi:large subunit ribosomal protein L29
MKFAELKDMTVAELAVKGRDLRQELFNLRLQKATAQLEKPSRLRILRKDIARIETRVTQLRKQSAQPKVA